MQNINGQINYLCNFLSSYPDETFFNKGDNQSSIGHLYAFPKNRDVCMGIDIAPAPSCTGVRLPPPPPPPPPSIISVQLELQVARSSPYEPLQKQTGPFFLSLNTGTIKFWSLRQGVQFWNFEEKTKTKQKNKNKTKKTKKNLSAVFLTKWGVP